MEHFGSDYRSHITGYTAPMIPLPSVRMFHLGVLECSTMMFLPFHLKFPLVLLSSFMIECPIHLYERIPSPQLYLSIKIPSNQKKLDMLEALPLHVLPNDETIIIVQLSLFTDAVKSKQSSSQNRDTYHSLIRDDTESRIILL